MALAVMIGFFSHLLLDEICSVDLKGARVNKAFGTAHQALGPVALVDSDDVRASELPELDGDPAVAEADPTYFDLPAVDIPFEASMPREA